MAFNSRVARVLAVRLTAPLTAPRAIAALAATAVVTSGLLVGVVPGTEVGPTTGTQGTSGHPDRVNPALADTGLADSDRQRAANRADRSSRTRSGPPVSAALSSPWGARVAEGTGIGRFRAMTAPSTLANLTAPAGLTAPSNLTAPSTTAAPRAGAKQAASTKTSAKAPVPPSWVAPIRGATMTSCFGARWGTVHQGIDFAATAGTTIVSVGSGTVVEAGWLYSGYGMSVVVDHGNGYLTHYAHASAVLVRAGQRVKAGTPLAREGSTGDSTGPHLHFEVHRGELWHQIEPASWLRKRGVKVSC